MFSKKHMNMDYEVSSYQVHTGVSIVSLCVVHHIKYEHDILTFDNQSIPITFVLIFNGVSFLMKHFAQEVCLYCFYLK